MYSHSQTSLKCHYIIVIHYFTNPRNQDFLAKTLQSNGYKEIISMFAEAKMINGNVNRSS